MASKNLMKGYQDRYGDKIQELTEKAEGYGSYQYGNQDAYNKLIDSVANRKEFSYDPSQDASYGAYRKQYLREGDRASANALAQASAASGGRPSSYAVTAANQAGNYYAGQAADKLPELEQNAYQRYLSDFQANLSSLGAMQTDRQTGYNEWMDQYNMLQNSLGNYQNQEATAYQKYLDRIANAMGLYSTLGYATSDVRKTLGIPKEIKQSGVSYGGSAPAETGGITDDQWAQWKANVEKLAAGGNAAAAGTVTYKANGSTGTKPYVSRY